MDAANVLVISVGETIPHDEGIARRHHEDHHDALHCTRHRIFLERKLQFRIFEKSLSKYSNSMLIFPEQFAKMQEFLVGILKHF